jgi:hypothetical protein
VKDGSIIIATYAFVVKPVAVSKRSKRQRLHMHRPNEDQRYLNGKGNAHYNFTQAKKNDDAMISIPDMEFGELSLLSMLLKHC